MDGLHICGTKISLYKDGLLVEGKVDYTSDNLIAKGRCKALGDCFFFSGTVKHLTSQGDWDLLTYKIGELEGPTYTTTYFDNGKKYIKEGINHKGLFSGIMTIMQGERIVQRESQVDGKREGLYEEFDAEGKLVEKMLYEKGKVVHDFFAEEKEAKRLAEEQAKKAEEERKIFIAERKKHVEALVFAKRSDAQARQETLKAVLAAKSRKEKLKILKKFHTEKANVVRFTALKFREIE